jgi:hypothetical protein
LPGPAAVAVICACIPTDHALIHASWVCSESPSLAGPAPRAGGGPATGAGGGSASWHTGGAGSARPARGGPSSSAISVSSATGRRPRRANAASPPASASTSPVISHTIRVPYRSPLALGRAAAARACRHPRAQNLGPPAPGRHSTGHPDPMNACPRAPAPLPLRGRKGLGQHQIGHVTAEGRRCGPARTTRGIHATASATPQSPTPDYTVHRAPRGVFGTITL